MKTKKEAKKISAIILMVTIAIGITMGLNADHAKAASDKTKKACAAVLKATGNINKIGYKSAAPSDFDAISYKYEKKVSSMFFVTSDNTAYNVCVAKAKTADDAKVICKAFSTYRFDKIHGTYFKTDYTKAEQAIIKNAVYGRKGKYVWYISMASKKKNLAGERALRKKL